MSHQINYCAACDETVEGGRNNLHKHKNKRSHRDKAKLMSTSGPVNKGEFHCKQCDSRPTYAKQLETHVLMTHTFIQCAYCDMHMVGLRKYTTHFSVYHHYRGVKKYTKVKSLDEAKLNEPSYCDSCDVAFNMTKELRNHIRMKHPTNYNSSLSCNICGQAYKLRSSLSRHLKQAHKDFQIENSETVK